MNAISWTVAQLSRTNLPGTGIPEAPRREPSHIKVLRHISTTDWRTTAEVAKRAGCNAGYIAAVLRASRLAGLVERKGGTGSKMALWRRK